MFVFGTFLNLITYANPKTIINIKSIKSIIFAIFIFIYYSPPLPQPDPDPDPDPDPEPPSPPDPDPDPMSAVPSVTKSADAVSLSKYIE
jgi:hypothetical protein